MKIVGALLKNAIQLSQSLSIENDPIKAQRQQLLNLLNKAENTAFGKFYGFAHLKAQDDFIKAFQANVPILDYNGIKPWWTQQQKFSDITWPGQANFFALSSGTTGKTSKRIPVTNDMLDSFRSVSLAQIAALNQFDLPPAFFESGVLALGSSTNLEERNGHLEGEISGINAFNAPQWFDRFYKPGQEIAQIDDWDDRIEAIVEKADQWDIGAIAGIPSWILMMLKTVKKHYQLKDIHELWPNLSVYVTGGVAFEPYRDNFDALFSQSMYYMDTYLASEGFFAFNNRPETNAMQLATNHGIFYEFIPFNKNGFTETGKLLENPQVLTLAEVEENQDYALLVSTPAGAWRYMIGDTIKFTDLEKMEILITGRTKYFLNVVGSQLSEDKLNKAIQTLSQEMDVVVNEFSVSALQNDAKEYYHQWVISSENKVDEVQAKEVLDQALKKLNKNYRVAREKALKAIQVKFVAEETFYNWLEANKKKGGQIKVPKVMKAEKMQELLAYVAT